MDDLLSGERFRRLSLVAKIAAAVAMLAGAGLTAYTVYYAVTGELDAQAPVNVLFSGGLTVGAYLLVVFVDGAIGERHRKNASLS